MKTLRSIVTNEILLRADGEWLHFSNPFRILEAKEIQEVLPALRQIEQLVESNKWHAAGFLSYEAASAFDSALEARVVSLPEPSPEQGRFPLLWFGLYPEPIQVKIPTPQGAPAILKWQSTTRQETYNGAIATIREHIAEGRTYQVNYTMRLRSGFTGSPWDLFLRLAQSQNNHAAYVDTGSYAICSASPELFFQLDGNTITCRPMKGTVSRGRTTAEDTERTAWLKHSEKNRAENVMIVDMVRNDLGRIARMGSVVVPRLFEIEKYPTLWQMTSTVKAKTDSSVSEIFAALFPCASITGAPKVSTMRIISALESTPRKIYTGTIGYLAPGRKARFNVAIRTALIDRERQQAEYGVGGGVVWDSTSHDEYEEAMLKARVLLEEQQPFSLLETLLWTPEEGFFLCQKHVARILDSAEYFDIPITKHALEQYLTKISTKLQAAQRVRLLLSKGGDLDWESHPFEMAEHRQLLKAVLAKEPVNSGNVFLFHKTTRREVYENARKGTEMFDDVLLYNEKRQLTEFTIGNLVVELNGQLLTPPISCGVLAGTFRAHLLETGQIIEQTISIEQLANCTKVFRVNSLRRWQEVDIQR